MNSQTPDEAKIAVRDLNSLKPAVEACTKQLGTLTLP
jgi:hypothetical protein